MRLDRDTLKQIVQEIITTRPDEISCQHCFEHLDRFAELTLVGKDASEAMPLVQDHLAHCNDGRFHPGLWILLGPARPGCLGPVAVQSRRDRFALLGRDQGGLEARGAKVNPQQQTTPCGHGPYCTIPTMRWQPDLNDGSVYHRGHTNDNDRWS